jgi:hypothetical protein
MEQEGSLLSPEEPVTDSTYFHFSNVFYILQRALLHHILSNYGLSSDYLNWFLSYLTNRQSRVRYSGIFSSPFVVQAGVPQGPVLGPLLLNIFINDLCDVINHNCLLFAADLKTYRAISSPSEQFFLHSDNDCGVRKILRSLISVKLIISFTRTTKILNYQYRLGYSFYCEQISLRIWVRTLTVNFIFIVMPILFPYALKLVGLIHSNILFFHLRQYTDATFSSGQM